MISGGIITKSPQGTQKIASLLAAKVVRAPYKKAVVIALEGELGAGKTTFVQGFARALGVKENVLSPTFVLIKAYQLPAISYKLKYLVHIDCYRIDSPKDLLYLGFRELLKDRDAVILIEWADRVRKLIPRNALRVKFMHGKKPRERSLKISNF